MGQAAGFEGFDQTQELGDVAFGGGEGIGPGGGRRRGGRRQEPPQVRVRDRHHLPRAVAAGRASAIRRSRGTVASGYTRWPEGRRSGTGNP